jgi:hypothetical protein
MLNPANRFHAAISVLCGSGELKQRLVSAYLDNLAQIEKNDLPPDIRKCFSDLRERMSSVAPLNGEGAVRASVRKMSVAEADKCARMVADMHVEIMRCVDDAQTSLPLEAHERDIAPPPFLVNSV